MKLLDPNPFGPFPPEPRHARVERMAWEILLMRLRAGTAHAVPSVAESCFDLAEAFLDEADRRAADEALGKGER